VAEREPASRWWLSFCDPALPENSQFLGAAIVPGADISTASIIAWGLGCNPGGEVLGIEIPLDLLIHVPITYLDRLLTRAECEDLDRIMLASLQRKSEDTGA